MLGVDSFDSWKEKVLLVVEASTLEESRKCRDGSECNIYIKNCNNYFCLLCNVEELCPTAFRPRGPHCGHPWLKVRHLTGKSVVAAKDLEHYIGKASVSHIQQFLVDDEFLCCLNTQLPGTFGRPSSSCISNLPKCESCNYDPESDRERKDFQVCSEACLRRIAELRPNLNLIRMKNLAMDRTLWPLIATAKTEATAQVKEPMVQTMSKNLKRKRCSPSTAAP